MDIEYVGNDISNPNREIINISHNLSGDWYSNRSLTHIYKQMSIPFDKYQIEIKRDAQTDKYQFYIHEGELIAFSSEIIKSYISVFDIMYAANCKFYELIGQTEDQQTT